MKEVPRALSVSGSIKAAGYASAGIRHALLNEPAFQRIVIAEIVVGFGLGWYLFPLSKVEVGLLVLAAVLPLVTEILNTGFEAFIDRVHPEKHESAKIAKDCAAGATLLAASASAIICAALVFLR